MKPYAEKLLAKLLKVTLAPRLFLIEWLGSVL